MHPETYNKFERRIAMKTYDPRVDITLFPTDWRELSTKALSRYDLMEIKHKLERFVDRFDLYGNCLIAVAEDEDAPERIWKPFSDAYDKLYKMIKYAEEGIDVIDSSLKAWEELEDNLQFVFRDIAKLVVNL